MLNQWSALLGEDHKIVSINEKSISLQTLDEATKSSYFLNEGEHNTPEHPFNILLRPQE